MESGLRNNTQGVRGVVCKSFPDEMRLSINGAKISLGKIMPEPQGSKVLKKRKQMEDNNEVEIEKQEIQEMKLDGLNNIVHINSVFQNKPFLSQHLVKPYNFLKTSQGNLQGPRQNTGKDINSVKSWSVYIDKMAKSITDPIQKRKIILESNLIMKKQIENFYKVIHKCLQEDNARLIMEKLKDFIKQQNLQKNKLENLKNKISKKKVQFKDNQSIKYDMVSIFENWIIFKSIDQDYDTSIEDKQLEDIEKEINEKRQERPDHKLSILQTEEIERKINKINKSKQIKKLLLVDLDRFKEFIYDLGYPRIRTEEIESFFQHILAPLTKKQQKQEKIKKNYKEGKNEQQDEEPKDEKGKMNKWMTQKKIEEKKEDDDFDDIFKILQEKPIEDETQRHANFKINQGIQTEKEKVIQEEKVDEQMNLSKLNPQYWRQKLKDQDYRILIELLVSLGYKEQYEGEMEQFFKKISKLDEDSFKPLDVAFRDWQNDTSKFQNKEKKIQGIDLDFELIEEFKDWKKEEIQNKDSFEEGRKNKQQQQQYQTQNQRNASEEKNVNILNKNERFDTYIPNQYLTNNQKQKSDNPFEAFIKKDITKKVENYESKIFTQEIKDSKPDTQKNLQNSNFNKSQSPKKSRREQNDTPPKSEHQIKQDKEYQQLKEQIFVVEKKSMFQFFSKLGYPNIRKIHLDRFYSQIGEKIKEVKYEKQCQILGEIYGKQSQLKKKETLTDNYSFGLVDGNKSKLPSKINGSSQKDQAENQNNMSLAFLEKIYENKEFKQWKQDILIVFKKEFFKLMETLDYPQQERKIIENFYKFNNLLELDESHKKQDKSLQEEYQTYLKDQNPAKSKKMFGFQSHVDDKKKKQDKEKEKEEQQKKEQEENQKKLSLMDILKQTQANTEELSKNNKNLLKSQKPEVIKDSLKSQEQIDKEKFEASQGVLDIFKLKTEKKEQNKNDLDQADEIAALLGGTSQSENLAFSRLNPKAQQSQESSQISINEVYLNYKKFLQEKKSILGLLSQKSAKERNTSLLSYLNEYIKSYENFKFMLNQLRDEEDHALEILKKELDEPHHDIINELQSQLRTLITKKEVGRLLKDDREQLDIQIEECKSKYQHYMLNNLELYDDCVNKIQQLIEERDKIQFERRVLTKWLKRIQSNEVLGTKILKERIIEEKGEIEKNLDVVQKFYEEFGNEKLRFQEKYFKIFEVANFLYSNGFDSEQIDIITKFTEKIKCNQNQFMGKGKYDYIQPKLEISMEIMEKSFNLYMIKNQERLKVIAKLYDQIVNDSQEKLVELRGNKANASKNQNVENIFDQNFTLNTILNYLVESQENLQEKNQILSLISEYIASNYPQNGLFIETIKYYYQVNLLDMPETYNSFLEVRLRESGVGDHYRSPQKKLF